MRRATLALALVLSGALVQLAPDAGAAAACRHQLTDPRGDVDAINSAGAYAPALDVVSADVRTTSREVVATIELDDLPEEGGTPIFDSSYSVDFSTNGERYLLSFHGAKPDSWAMAWHVVAGSDQPEQENGAGAQAAEGVADALAFTIDLRRDTVTMRFARAAFDEFGGIGRTLTRIAASAWSGNGVQTRGSGVGGYGSTDFGYSKVTYRDRAASCA